MIKLIAFLIVFYYLAKAISYWWRFLHKLFKFIIPEDV
ncbi:hypothetical protein FDJ25_gp020 [Vibrio phage Aphrodite1]|uniref:Uncharacterized protein n=2 Tax=Aphroditevirus TaxID=2560092 RepID=A0A2I7QI92_9CAUD|nr:hypothetical protein FDJ25_gp020 [Vibrio phage Aphrodite1]AUR81105.1 hypothetical protein Aphrodite1_0190 [Vibrio phage Aphrodite1]QCW23150.1 hypothetical protein [Vibrio phage 5 TSL-2019]